MTALLPSSTRTSCRRGDSDLIGLKKLHTLRDAAIAEQPRYSWISNQHVPPSEVAPTVVVASLCTRVLAVKKGSVNRDPTVSVKAAKMGAHFLKANPNRPISPLHCFSQSVNAPDMVCFMQLQGP